MSRGIYDIAGYLIVLYGVFGRPRYDFFINTYRPEDKIGL